MNFEEKVEKFVAHKHRESRKQKKLGASSIPSLLDSTDGSMWTGTIYMGRWQPMNVVFDTASDWLMVESYNCVNCEGIGNSTGEVYNTTKSIMISDEEEGMSQRYYGEAILKGYEFEDTVCLLLGECVSSFKYFAIL